jgi:hypothetical protein
MDDIAIFQKIFMDQQSLCMPLNVCCILSIWFMFESAVLFLYQLTILHVCA